MIPAHFSLWVRALQEFIVLWDYLIQHKKRTLSLLEILQKNIGELLLWLSRFRTLYSVCENVGLIPGLAQWVKDPVLLQAAVQVVDVARIPHCCSCGVGRLAQEPPYVAGVAIKRENKQTNKNMGLSKYIKENLQRTTTHRFLHTVSVSLSTACLLHSCLALYLTRQWWEKKGGREQFLQLRREQVLFFISEELRFSLQTLGVILFLGLKGKKKKKSQFAFYFLGAKSI